MAKDINTDQHYPHVVLVVLDAEGRPAQVDGVPVWASSNSTVLSVKPAADGMSAVVDTVAPGVARITVKADADMGAGVAEITGFTEDVTVSVGPSHTAALIQLDLGTPVDK